MSGQGAVGNAQDIVDTLAKRVTDQIYEVGIQLNRAVLSDSMAESSLVTNQETRASYESIDYAEMISVYEYDNMGAERFLVRGLEDDEPDLVGLLEVTEFRMDSRPTKDWVGRTAVLSLRRGRGAGIPRAIREADPLQVQVGQALFERLVTRAKRKSGCASRPRWGLGFPSIVW